MFNQMSKVAKGIITLALVGLMGVGCAADMGEVDLVQPDYIKKSDLLNKSWYYRRTVVDTSESHQPFFSIGTGDLFTIMRIKFDIQENMLVGYTDYEWVDGTEEAGNEGSVFTEYGNPIVAFRISKHFDIARRYDSATGQPTNVLSENASDNEWYDREYMRVDWGREMMDHNFFVLDAKSYPVNSISAIGEQRDPANPYRARLTPDEGYFDFTTALTMIPDWYQCLYQYGFSWFTCGQGETLVRHSFKEVDEEELAGYEALDYPDTVPVTDAEGNEIRDPESGEVVRSKVWERFGYYRLEKFTYDDHRGLTETGRLNKIIRFNIWEKSINADGTKIPYAQRTPKAITYYLNWDFPADLLDTAKEVGEEWNGVFKRTVAALQGKSEADVPDMFIVKENTCSMDSVNNYLAANSKIKADVNAAVVSPMSTTTLGNYCAATEYYSRKAGLAEPFVWQQTGDVRFNMLTWITQKTPSGFSGYGPMLGDPVTGLNVVSTANVMGWTIDSAAARARDYIDYQNGDLTLENLLAGNHRPNLMNSPEYMPGENINNPMGMEEMHEMAQESASAEHIAELEARFQELGDSPDELLVELENSQHFEERLARIEGTPFEQEHLIRLEDMVAGNQGQWAPGDAITDEVLANASPIRNMRVQKFKRDGFYKQMEARTFCPMANLDDALIGIAKELEDKTSDERFQIIRKRLFRAVALHEIGHNVGLRHNFEASYDSLNYNKTFWDIQESGATYEEMMEQHQTEYRYSSIMDYHGKINGDFRGLGLYDEAAIKFGYGQLLETFQDASAPSGKDLREWNFKNDYKKLPTELGGVDTMYERDHVLWDWTDADKRKQSVVDSVESKEVPYLFCSDEYAGWTPTCNRFDYGANYRELQAARYTRYKNYFIFSNYLNGRIELPIGGLQMRGYRTFRDIITAYQYMYFYRANDPDFFNTDLGADMATAVGQGFNMMGEVIAMPEPGRYYKCTDDNTTPLDPTDDKVYYYPSWLTSYTALEQDNALNPIAYGLDRETCIRADRAPTDGVVDESVVLPLGDAQPLFLDFTDDFVTWTWEYVGTYWDKMFALRELADPWTRFYRNPGEGREDSRNLAISPLRLYNDEVMSILSNVISYNRKGIGGTLSSTGEFTPRTFVDLNSSSMPAAPSEPIVITSLAANLQRMAVMFGLALLTSPVDEKLDFGKHTRVVLDGGMDDVGFFDQQADQDVATCTLPDSGMTFKARMSEDGYNIGFDMVTECHDAADYLTNHTYDEVLQKRHAWEEMRNALYAKECNSQSDEGMRGEPCQDHHECGASVAAKCELIAEPNLGEKDALNNLYNEYSDSSRDWSRNSFKLTKSEQLLNYMRRIHLVYEHGVGW